MPRRLDGYTRQVVRNPRVLTINDPNFASQYPYKNIFHVPSDAACEIDVEGDAGPNTVTLGGLDAAGTAIQGKSADVSNGKVFRAALSSVFSRTPSTITLDTLLPANAVLTCAKQIGSFSYFNPWTGTQVTVPLISAQSVQDRSYASQGLTLLPMSPFMIFSEGNDVYHDDWRITTTAFQNQDPSQQLNISLRRLDSQNSTTKTYSIAQATSNDRIIMDLADDSKGIFSIGELAMSGTGTMGTTRSDTKPGAFFGQQLFTGYDRIPGTPGKVNGISVPLNLPIESAARDLYFPLVFVPRPQNDAWRAAIAIIPTTTKPWTTYLTPYDGSGNKLGDVVIVSDAANMKLTRITLDKAANRLEQKSVYDLGSFSNLLGVYVAQTQDIFDKIPEYDKTEWVRATADERVHGLVMYKYGQHIIALPASTNLDLGKRVRGLRATLLPGQAASYALLNPTHLEQTVTATAYGMDGQPVNLGGRTSQSFKIPARTRLAGTANWFLQSDNLASAAYVEFVASGTPEYDFHNPKNSITGISITGDANAGVHIEGTVLSNRDDLRVLLEANNFNPRNRTEWFETNDGPATLNATVITKDSVSTFTYNPLADGNLTRALSATLTTQLPDARFYATGNTVTGVDDNQIPVRTYDPIDTGYKPEITINTPTPSKIKTTMTRVADYTIESVDKTVGVTNWSYNTIKADPSQIAKIFYDNRISLTNPNENQRSQEQWSLFFTNLTTDSRPDRFKSDSIRLNESSNGFLFQTVDMPIGTYLSLPIANTPAGESLMQQLKQFFQVGERYTHRLMK